jgi:hypothetical protein
MAVRDGQNARKMSTRMMQVDQREAPNMKGQMTELAMGKMPIYWATGIAISESYSVKEHFTKGPGTSPRIWRKVRVHEVAKNRAEQESSREY